MPKSLGFFGALVLEDVKTSGLPCLPFNPATHFYPLSITFSLPNTLTLLCCQEGECVQHFIPLFHLSPFKVSRQEEEAQFTESLGRNDLALLSIHCLQEQKRFFCVP